LANGIRSRLLCESQRDIRGQPMRRTLWGIGRDNSNDSPCEVERVATAKGRIVTVIDERYSEIFPLGSCEAPISTLHVRPVGMITSFIIHDRDRPPRDWFYGLNHPVVRNALAERPALPEKRSGCTKLASKTRGNSLTNKETRWRLTRRSGPAGAVVRRASALSIWNASAAG
jgi:hypothetical protein